MTDQGNGQPKVYDVRLSEQNRALLRKRHAEAAQRGEGKRFVSALRQIIDRLQKDPVNFGEPSFHLPALKLTIYRAAVAPLVVEYGVHEEKPVVFIRGFRVFS